MKLEKILLVKSHSLGVGDILRSSAAWQALQSRYPSAELHLLFLSRHAGYPSEELLRDHHLLKGVYFVTVREGEPNQSNARRTALGDLKAQVQRIGSALGPDLVIDFEAAGLRTTFVTRWVAKACHAKTIGIAQFLGRGWLYDQSAPSTRVYMKVHGLKAPIDYAERDFVVLAALGIKRQGQAITLQLTQAGQNYKDSLMLRLHKQRCVVGLNIGCGTPDAVPRRPPLKTVAAAIHEIAQTCPIQVLLVGAKFEKVVNQEFMLLYRQDYGDQVPMLDVSGETSLSAATGALGVCQLFISSDSGPYHMAVAQKIPTLAWFVRDEPAAYHRVDWCRCLVNPEPSEVLAAAQSLLGWSEPASIIDNAPSLNKAA